jgi:hypothetical protein
MVVGSGAVRRHLRASGRVLRNKQGKRPKLPRAIAVLRKTNGGEITVNPEQLVRHWVLLARGETPGTGEGVMV